MVKKLGAVVMAAVLLCIFGGVKADAAESKTYIGLGINDRFMEYTTHAPFTQNGISYASSSYLSFMGVKSSTSGNTKVFTKGTTKLTVDLTTYSMKLNNKALSTKAVMHNRTLYLPIRQSSTAFGYTVSYIKSGPVVRVKNSSAKLTDTQFYTKYKSAISAQRTKFTQPQQQPAPTKIAYLTFDDGPNVYTASILNMLQKNGAKATFFMMKPSMDRMPSIVKRMKNEGHGLACHGVTHDKSKFYRSPSSAEQEMTSCLASIRSITGVSSKLIRTPYGSKPNMTQAYRQAMYDKGYKMWDWTVDSLDWKYRHAPTTANHTISEIKKMEGSKKPLVILMHDRVDTTDYLQPVLNYLKKSGYQMKPLDNSMKPYNFWQ
ncbi:polysaccharide deacetylase family protein [Fictibacillus aquaticus]|uniref:NodB homology domain-containing protein n=1 Tax=Fictibacillus aquaticus TaxID=2021314 RepID=A0A235F979_9BACL|nr:polysaccharide deacetylase family protein [Fictibacillus aquaticus]OYD57729.1 hypothetical protein CGZ90_13800 [Fictibacillus aquaticus]